MSYRHRKGNRERPVIIVPMEGGYFGSYNGNRYPIQIFASGRFEDDYLPPNVKRGGGTRNMVASMIRKIYGHGPQFKENFMGKRS